MSRCPVFYLDSTSKSQGGVSLSEPDKGTIYGSYLYWNSDSADGKWVAEDNTVHLGISAGRIYPGIHTVAIGAYAATNKQGNNAVAVGEYAGNKMQGANSIAIGQYAGYQTQGANSIAVGLNTGYENQGANTVAIGSNAGVSNQGQNSIAIGLTAGFQNQGANTVAIGPNAGAINQGQNSIAIGSNAGGLNQGQNSIAIGPNAGATGQYPNSIILNAGLTALNTFTPGFFINPIRGVAGTSSVLSYNVDTCEVYYNGSSERYKYDIAPLTTDTSTLYNLQPRTFKYKLNDEPDIGLIAEEAFMCDPAFVYLDKGLIPAGIQWNTITTYLVAEFKKLKMEIDNLELID